MAAYINEKPAEEQHELKELMIYNLARLHSMDDTDFKKTYDMIEGAYITHHAYDWSKDPHASGAFALFSPGNFSQHYPALVRPWTDSRLYIVGEAASAHHAWIVGALDSAMRGVCTMLARFGLEDLQAKLVKEFGTPHEIDQQSLQAQIALGKLKPEEQPKAPIVVSG